MKLKIHNRELPSISEYVLALCFLLPYIETSSVKEQLQIVSNNTIIFASVIILLIASVILVSIGVICTQSIKIEKTNEYRYIFSFLLYVFLVGLCVASNYRVLIIQILWMFVPPFYAMLFFNTAKKMCCNIEGIFKIGIVYFWMYMVFLVFYNILVYGFSVGSRMTSTGGGAVIYGYTIVPMTILMLCFKSEFSKCFQIVFMITALVNGLFVGSRGALWPLLIILVVFIFRDGNAIQKSILFLSTIMIVIIANPLAYIIELYPRMARIISSSRLQTWSNSIQVLFHESTIGQFLFGRGVGQFFPYQEWYLTPNKYASYIDYNVFVYEGYPLCVQPHNIYVYTLLEMGVVGFGFLLLIVYKGFKKVDTKMKKLLFVSIVALNCFDSVFWVSPGAAGLWWLLLLFSIGMNKKDKYV